jgi:Ca-activated chloride channel homolog
MMNRRSVIQILLNAGAGSYFAKVIASTPPENQKRDYTLRTDVVLVLLDVSVKDSQGRFVRDLGKDNFSLFEDGKRQNITVFDSEDRPVTLGILLDQSFSMTPKRQDVLTAAETLINESNRLDEVFVIHFGDRVSFGLPGNVPFSDDIRQLRTALSRGVPGGRTALNDAIFEGLQHLRLGRRDKKTLVLVSDGGDTASEHNRKETLEFVQRSVATIYTIGLFDPNDPDHDTHFLRQLAKISGGEPYFPATPGELVPLCRRIAKEIRMRYTIGYTPQPGDRPNSLRHIQVHAGGAGYGKLTVRCRNKYRYEETPAGK